MPSTRFGMTFGALAALVWLGSCAPPVVTAGLSVAEAGSAVFFEGNLQGAIKNSLLSVFAATNLALADLAYEPTVSNLKERSAEITARESNDGRLVVVTLKESTPRVTLIQVRVGLFGDQQISRLVMSEIVDVLEPDAKTHPTLRVKCLAAHHPPSSHVIRLYLMMHHRARKPSSHVIFFPSA